MIPITRFPIGQFRPYALVLFSALWPFSAACAGEPVPVRTPHWVWNAGVDREADSAVELNRTFMLRQPIERATLRATADFATLSLAINGRSVTVLEPYDPSFEIDVAPYLADGDNIIQASAVGVAGPSAIAISLEVASEDAPPIVIQTDDQWRSDHAAGILELGRVDPHRWALNRLPEVSPFAEYNQWKEAIGGDVDSQLSPLPTGFEITKIRDARESEDSWISLAIAPDGRLIIGKEQQGLLRLTLSEDGEQVIAADTIGETLQECRGLVWQGDSLYVHANRTGGLFRLRDANGDDRFETVTRLLTTAGGTGHGRNALALGPDQAVHAILGDDIRVPDAAPRRAPPEAAADRELGHQARLSEHAGDVTWQSLNRGLRNPYGIDFNPDGEAFTYDADNEGDAGLPLYRPTRINHLVSGANYGWHQDRQNTRSFPVYAPDSVPTTFDMGRGSPTGIKFGTRSHFPSPWREALFALDWAYGRILAVHLTPRGASYYGSGELFLEGRPLNVTDLDFDRDGAMWFITGGRKTHSALYRVRYVGQPPGDGGGVGEQATARSAFSTRSRRLRKSLERFHAPSDPAAVDEIWPSLGDHDPWIRGAARVALEWQPVEGWRDRALAPECELGGLTAMLALVRAGSDQDRQRAAAAIALMNPASFGRTEKLNWLRIHQLAGSSEDSHVRQQLAAGLLSMAEDDSEAVKREVSRGLVLLNSPRAVSYSLQRLAAVVEQADRLHYLEVLGDAKDGWSPPQRRQFFTALAYAKRFSHGDRFMPPFFDAIEQAALANIADEAERSELAGMLALPVEPESVAVEARPLVRTWTLSDLDAQSADGKTSGNAKRGRDLFVAASCASCHVCGTTGRPLGPDLTTVASRFSRRDLLESIIDPSLVIAEAFRNVVVLQSNGTLTTGRIIRDDFRNSKLIVAPQADAPSHLLSIPKAEIESWHESPVSPMPAGLLDTLTQQEIEDLLAFLIAGGDKE